MVATASMSAVVDIIIPGPLPEWWYYSILQQYTTTINNLDPGGNVLLGIFCWSNWLNLEGDQTSIAGNNRNVANDIGCVFFTTSSAFMFSRKLPSGPRAPWTSPPCFTCVVRTLQPRLQYSSHLFVLAHFFLCRVEACPCPKPGFCIRPIQEPMILSRVSFRTERVHAETVHQMQWDGINTGWKQFSKRGVWSVVTWLADPWSEGRGWFSSAPEWFQTALTVFWIEIRRTA